MRTNTARKVAPVFTHEGGRSPVIDVKQQLARRVSACMLWDDQFYESGEATAKEIYSLALRCPPAFVANLAISARSELNLRHVPLLLLVALAKTGSGSRLVSDTVAAVVQRADEIGELLAIYWKVQPDASLSAQLKRGLALAFAKFGEYALAKYDRDGEIKLRDVMRLVHPKPIDEARSGLYQRVVKRTLATPDTWETELSGGADKKATFERLIAEDKLGYLALLRNLRGMAEAGVDPVTIKAAIRARKGGAQRVMPFRYLAALRAAPQFADALDDAMIASVEESAGFDGLTVVMVDVSSSMRHKVTAKSELTRMDAAAAIAALIKGERRVFSFSDSLIEVPAYNGMALIDSVMRSQMHGGTHLFDAVDVVNRSVRYSRIIVITDEQAADDSQRHGGIQGTLDKMPAPHAGAKAYVINVGAYANGVGFGPWVTISGFSEAVLSYIRAVEAESVASNG